MKPDLPIRPGERLVWSGVPDPSVIFTPADLFLVPFSLLWAGFAVFWLAGVSASGAPVFFMLFGGFFVLVGAYMVVGRFFVKAWRKRQAVYAITDSRAVAVVGGTTRETTLPAFGLTRTRSRDGRHLSVTFEGPAGGGSFFAMGTTIYRNSGMEFFGRQLDGAVSFFDVADADGLQTALDQIQTRSR